MNKIRYLIQAAILISNFSMVKGLFSAGLAPGRLFIALALVYGLSILLFLATFKFKETSTERMLAALGGQRWLIAGCLFVVMAGFWLLCFAILSGYQGPDGRRGVLLRVMLQSIGAFAPAVLAFFAGLIAMLMGAGVLKTKPQTSLLPPST